MPRLRRPFGSRRFLSAIGRAVVSSVGIILVWGVGRAGDREQAGRARNDAGPATRPQILPHVLPTMRDKARDHTVQWREFKARLDDQLAVPIGAGYQGSGNTWISDYAAGYQALKDIDEDTARIYADKALGLMIAAVRDSPRADNSCMQFLARGDGRHSAFTLADTDYIPSSVRVHLTTVLVVSATKGAAHGEDVISNGGSPAVNAQFLKLSRTPDGPADYIMGRDWRPSTTREGAIEWLGAGREPAAGTRYYVTMVNGFEVPAGLVQPSTWSLSDTTLTLQTAPAPDQAVYVSYVYGTHSADGSRLAYQQTGFGMGGDFSVMVDNGYAGRYLGKHTAHGLDWLDGYAGLTPRLRSAIMNRLAHWFEQLAAHGYYYGSPHSNYGAGMHISNVWTALALRHRDPVHGPAFMKSIAGWRRFCLPWVMTDRIRDVGSGVPRGGPCSLRGGFWAEGWGYGALACKNLLLAGLAWEQAGQGQAAVERAFASDAIAQILEGQPAGPLSSSCEDNGDWYQYPAWFPDLDLFYLLGTMADDPTRAGYARYVVRRQPVNPFTHRQQTNDWEDLAFCDPAARGASWTTSLPLQWLAGGTGLLVARSDWTPQATWLSFAAGNLLLCDHQDMSPGKLRIQRGADDLLVSGAHVAGVMGVRSKYENVVVVDDRGDGAQTYRWSMGVWYDNPGIRDLAYEAAAPAAFPAGYVYRSCDCHAAYSPSSTPGSGGSTRELIRSLVYLRPDNVLVHDRVRTTAADYPKQLRWHTLAAAEVSGDSWSVVAGDSRLFAHTFSASPLSTAATTEQVDKVILHRVVTEPASVSASLRTTTVFQAAAGSSESMDPHAAVASADGRMEGAWIGSQLVLFGRDGPVSPDTPVSYTFTSRASPMAHLLVDLVPGRSYRVTADDTAVGTFTATKAGTLTFTTTGTGRQTVTVR